jgi:hypothetical protein
MTTFFTFSSACTEDGGELVHFETIEEFETLKDFLRYSTDFQATAWMTGIYSDPFKMFSSGNGLEKM